MNCNIKEVYQICCDFFIAFLNCFLFLCFQNFRDDYFFFLIFNSEKKHLFFFELIGSRFLKLVTSNNNSTTVPVVNYISAVTSTTSINATFNLTNINGVIYAGVEPNVANATSTPNASNLIQGYDGNKIQLASFGFAVASAGIPVTINFTGLTNSTQYYIYYVANNMDISVNGLYSTISNQTVSTNTPGSSFGSVIRISMMVFGLIMLALFGMI
jgi:hypothetical protein